jgi:hypothetical protein
LLLLNDVVGLVTRVLLPGYLVGCGFTHYSSCDGLLNLSITIVIASYLDFATREEDPNAASMALALTAIAIAVNALRHKLM